MREQRVASDQPTVVVDRIGKTKEPALTEKKGAVSYRQ